MSAQSIPAEPIFADPSERTVWNELLKRLPNEVTVICNLKMLDHSHEYEMDFLVLWPGVGVAVLETKGGKVQPNSDSTFHQSDSKGSRDIDPIAQVANCVHGLVRYVESKSSLQHFSPRHMLVFPYSHIERDYERPDIPRSIVIDEMDLIQIADRIQADLKSHDYRPSPQEIDILIQHLGRAIKSQKSLMESGIEREEEVLHLTEAQFSILDMCRTMPKFAILGAAGCGKTYIAMEQARRRALAGDRVLFLCYNRGLADYLSHRFAAMPENERPALVTTLHSLAYKWNLRFETRDVDEFWDIELPRLLIEHMESVPSDEKFDTVIIDEAQDFQPHWWDLVLAALKSREYGRIYAFGDTHQGIFRTNTDIPLVKCELHLDTNLRNSLPIAQLASLCVEEPLLLSGLDSLPVRYVETTDDNAIAAADDVVNQLLNAGWAPSDICVLTTGSRHPIQREQAELDRSAYWDAFFDANEVFYGHVLGFKGLERRVIVLAINGWKVEDQKKEMLYTAITRARDLLIICADKETLKHGGGKELVKKLVSTGGSPSQ
jgi:hypothetical protein